MKIAGAIFMLYLALLPGTLQAQEKSIQPRFTEFCTDEERTKECWHCKITTTDTLTNYILQLVSSKEESDYDTQWVCVQVVDRITGSLVQEIDVSEYTDAHYGGDDISIGDYNFDGYQDFSLYGGLGTLDNFYWFYFLFDPETETFFESGFDGTNLEFHSDSKTITSSNRCCAGSEMSLATYTLRNNRMVLVEQHHLTAIIDWETGEISYDEDGYLIFQERDSGIPYYLDVQLQCDGLKEECELRLAVYDEDMAGGFVQYVGKKERIPIHFARSEKIGDGSRLYFNEMCDDKIRGTYFFTLHGTAVDDVCYILGEESKTFKLK